MPQGGQSHHIYMARRCHLDFGGTAAGTYTLEIKRTRIVGKNDGTVIVPTDHAVPTLIACYPFHYIGSSPKRYVVSANLVAHR
jgi:sortase A